MSDGQPIRGGFFRGFLVGTLLSVLVAIGLSIGFQIPGQSMIAPTTPPEVALDVPTASSTLGAETSGVETPVAVEPDVVPVVPEAAPITPEVVAEPEQVTEVAPAAVDTQAAESPAVEAAVTPEAAEKPELQGFSADVTTPSAGVANTTTPRSAQSDLQAAELNAMLDSPDVSIEPMIPLEPLGGDLDGEGFMADESADAVNLEPMIPLPDSLEPLVDISPDPELSMAMEPAPTGADLAEEGIIPAGDAPADAPVVEGEDGVVAEAVPAAEGEAVAGEPVPGDAASAEAAPATDAADVAKPTGAMVQFALAFEDKGDRPLLAVVLVDAGASGQDIAKLAELGMPLTIGILSDVPGAIERSAEYRAAGFEVVAIAPKAGVGAFRRGQNTEEIPLQLEAIFSAVPQAVAVMDPPGGELPKDNQLVRAVLAGLQPSGHALLTQAGGFNSVGDLAVEAGIFSQTVMRQIEGVDAVNFAMSRAALQAGKTGAAIIMADTSPEMVQAVVQWLLSPSARSVALAPVSATAMK